MVAHRHRDPFSIDERRALVAGVALFAGLPDDAITHLVDVMAEEAQPAGAVVVREGDHGDTLYIVGRGTAVVTVRGGDAEIPVASLERGEIFGELALTGIEGARLATVTATSILQLLTLARGPFEALMARFPLVRTTIDHRAEDLLLVRFLRQATPFKTLPPDRIGALLAQIAQQRVPAGAVVIRQGDVGDVAYLLRQGRVEVCLEQGSDAHRLATLPPGSVFGEAALLSGAPRNATVRALEPCDLLVLRRDDLLAAVERDAELAGAMVFLLNARDRPRQAAGIEAHHRRTKDGQAVTVLKDPHRGRYYRLTPQGWLVWQRLDGDHTMRMLTLDYLTAFKTFAPTAVAGIVAGLAAAGFVETQALAADTSRLLQSASPLDRVAGAARRLLEWQVAYRGIDGALARLHAAGGGWFFTRRAQWPLAAVVVLGLVGFAVVTPTLLPTAAALGTAALLACLIATLVVAVVVHETGHALAVKAFGREVPRVGVGWYWIGPVAFVDTSDMWLAETWQRLVVSAAGPYANLVTGALAGLAAAAPLPTHLAAFCWWFAAVSFGLVIVNLNPLLDYDGYYLLCDWLDRPNLRTQALERLGAFAAAPSRWRLLLPGHGIDLAYAAASLAAVASIAVLSFLLWQAVLPAYIVGGRDFVAAMAGLVVGLASGTAALRPVARGFTKAQT